MSGVLGSRCRQGISLEDRAVQLVACSTLLHSRLGASHRLRDLVGYDPGTVLQ